MAVGWWQIIIVGVLVVLLFGRGKISDLMGDVAKGIKSFKKGMQDDVMDDNTHLEHNSAEIKMEDRKKDNSKA